MFFRKISKIREEVVDIPKLYVKFWWPLFLAMKFTFLFVNLAKIDIFIPESAYWPFAHIWCAKILAKIPANTAFRSPMWLQCRRGRVQFWGMESYLDKMRFLTSVCTGLHKLWYPSIRDTSTWNKFGAHGGHGDVFLFSNLGALWFSGNLIRYLLHVCLREVKNNLFSFKHSYLRHFLWRL